MLQSSAATRAAKTMDRVASVFVLDAAQHRKDYVNGTIYGVRSTAADSLSRWMASQVVW